MDFQPHLAYSNPYRTTMGFFRKDDPLLQGEKQSKIIQLFDSIANKSSGFLTSSLEKKIDLSGKIANVCDWSAWIFVETIEFTLFIDKVFSTGTGFSRLRRLSTYLTVPAAAAALGFGVLEGISELSNLQRMILLNERLEKHKGNPMAKLDWIKSHYFTLRAKESEGIQAYINKHFKTLSPQLKALKFQKLADKTLNNRFSSLKNRITPGLAKEVGTQLSILTRDLKSWNPLTRRNAHIRAEKLMESVSRQAKNKIVVHAFGLITIGITLLSMAFFLTGIAGGIYLIPLFILYWTLSSMRFLVEKGVLNREVDMYHKNIAEFNL